MSEHKYFCIVPGEIEFNRIPQYGKNNQWCTVDSCFYQFDDNECALFVGCGACPYPSDPRNKVCHQCLTQMGKHSLVFTSTIMRWSSFSGDNILRDSDLILSQWIYTYRELGLSAFLVETCLNEQNDIFGNKISAEYEETALVCTCGSCRNPMNPRYESCFKCIQAGASQMSRTPDYLVLIKVATWEHWPARDDSVISILELLRNITFKDMKKIKEIMSLICSTDDLNTKLILCNQGIRINSTVASLWAYKGETLYYLKRYEEALSCYEKAIQLVQDSGVLWYNRGIILKSLGKMQYALVSFDKALQYDPHDTDASAQKSACLRALGREPDEETRFYGNICPHCGKNLLENARFCYHCGKLVSGHSKKTCYSCHHTIPTTAQFCPYCGADTDTNVTRLY
ncbi:MAG: tetratricopeptide repeat protein [Candidatus Methanofastidiosia archaeon]|jgi:tetratricopeptide (TPR) repeat protein